MAPLAQLPVIPLIIDNQPIHPKGSAIVTNWSSNLNTEYAQYVSAIPEAAVAAAESAQMAFRSWSQTLPRTRRNILQSTAALMRENLAELVKIQMEETNCPEMWAANNVILSALHLEEIAGRITTALTGDLPVSQVRYTLLHSGRSSSFGYDRVSNYELPDPGPDRPCL